MFSQTIRANLLLLCAAAIWGSTFVAQKTAMEHIGPLWYTGLRFLLGLIVILPLLWLEKPARNLTWSDWRIGIGIGLLLFAGINLQQVALIFTSVTNAGFITGLYVVLVPIICTFAGHRYGGGVWLGVGMAVAGLYLLSVHGALEVNFGDVLTLASAFFWAFQVIALSSSGGHGLPPVRLAAAQFATCALLTLVLATILQLTESLMAARGISSAALATVTGPISFAAIGEAGFALLYGGIMSVGFGFTIQVLAQRHAPAAHSAIILSLESVFAALTGWLVLGDILDARVLTGCALMLGGTLLAQLSPSRPPADDIEETEPVSQSNT